MIMNNFPLYSTVLKEITKQYNENFPFNQIRMLKAGQIGDGTEQYTIEDLNLLINTI